MLRVNIENQGVLGSKLTERAVAFVGLDHKEPIPIAVPRSAETRMRHQLRHASADRVAGRASELPKSESEQGGSGCFAMHARDADASLALQESGQECGPPHTGNPQAP